MLVTSIKMKLDYFDSFSPRRITSSIESIPVDDEHRLIARYAARLAADAENTVSERGNLIGQQPV